MNTTKDSIPLPAGTIVFKSTLFEEDGWLPQETTVWTRNI